MELNCIQIDTHDNPDCAVIWLHGLGASGDDFVPIVEQLSIPSSIRARFIFPHAPIQPVSLNNGFRMPAWYDLHGLNLDSKEDELGLEKIHLEINKLVDSQIKHGISADKIVLAGFSQGGALALYAGLQHTPPLAGLVALSCYLPLRQQLSHYTKSTESSLPIFMAHGSMDDVVPLQFAQIAQQLLEQQGFTIDWHEYPCSHTVCAEEIADIREWLLERFTQT